jgi:ribosomal protein L29
MQVLLSDEKTREMLTEILIDLIQSRKELFTEIFQAALEEIGLANAIAEGRKNEFIPEENIFALLDGDAV